MGKTFEYTLTIRFQDGLDSEKIEVLSKAVKKAFDNRLGQMIDCLQLHVLRTHAHRNRFRGVSIDEEMV